MAFFHDQTDYQTKLESQTMPENDIPNFHPVSTTLFRGGQPTLSGLEKLKTRGVRTIINLREDCQAVREERSQVKNLGMEFIWIPLRPFDTPPETSIEKFLSLSLEKDRHPQFVHCLHGMDRTGMVIALYRMKVDNWPFEPAYEEMLERGFHEEFANLRSVVIEAAITWRKLPV